MDKVNFFILGAPKCGTTAMVDYLGQHPDVFFPKIKEPHFFCSDFAKYRRVTNAEDYRGLYPFAESQHTIYGDASVWYLYSTHAVKEIFEYNPDARLLIMLRRPVDMLPSLHSQLVFSNREDITDFEEAWAKVASRKLGKDIPKNALAAEHLYYDQVCKYAEQIKRVYDYFPKEQVKVVLFEDFAGDALGAVNDVLRFIKVGTSVDINITVVNQRREHRYPRLARFLMFPPFPLNVIKTLVKRIGYVKRSVPLRYLYEKNSVSKSKVVISDSLVADVKREYKSDVEALQSLIGHDLSHWKM